MRRAHDNRSWMSQGAVDRLTDITIDLLRENAVLRERLGNDERRAQVSSRWTARACLCPHARPWLLRVQVDQMGLMEIRRFVHQLVDHGSVLEIQRMVAVLGIKRQKR